MFDPTPQAVRAGRPFLYDTHAFSGLGHVACGSCHVDARMDRLAWDLGDPSGATKPFDQNCFTGLLQPCQDFHPMKGPMTTQSLRGMANHGPMHWRGDRTGGSNPGGLALDENAAFNRFIVAFEGLLGNDGPIATAAMQAFADFILEVTYPPNPIRALDNSLNASQAAAFAKGNGGVSIDPAQVTRAANSRPGSACTRIVAGSPDSPLST